MTLKAILFDLDGTLIDFNPSEFMKTYLTTASMFFQDIIPDNKQFIDELLASTYVMEVIDNNEKYALDVFLDDFSPKFNINREQIKERFKEFYSTKFDVIQPLITNLENSAEKLQTLQNTYPELNLVLATNPVFPLIAIRRRMQWGGLEPEYFKHITHAENSIYCKGNLKYWIETAKAVNCDPSQCLVVGNDVKRDMIAKKAGFTTFLVEQTIENGETHAIEELVDYKGGLADMLNLVADWNKRS